jgi:hydroxyacylglutathione hydrolase
MPPLSISTHILGPLGNNTYLLKDHETGTAVIVDPSFECSSVLDELQADGLQLSMVWITHAHFDHIAGVPELRKALKQEFIIGLHPADLELWNQSGGSMNFGIRLPALPQPEMKFYPGQILSLGKHQFSVRHTPGHTRGHVIFYSADQQTAFTGDLIFHHGVGRTDLAGGDEGTLQHSIRTQILTLPPETRLLSGHGLETTVQEEQLNNPFLI